MRVQILSDLHLEFPGNSIPPLAPDVDAVIMAGDLSPVSCDRMVEVRESWSDAEHVLFVPGNHEFYGFEIEAAQHELARVCKFAGITLLDPGAVVLDDTRFVGATLWTDFRLNTGPSEELWAHLDVARALNDFRGAIRHGSGLLSTYETARRHELERDFIEQELDSANSESQHAVVITHHAPSSRCIRPWYVGNRMNPGFASNLDELIHRYRPLLWVHGHMHNHVDEVVGTTRILANPYGYGPAEGMDFEPELVISLPFDPS